MKQYELNNYTIAFPEIPEGATDLELHDGSDPHITYKVGMGTEDFDILRENILPGDWQLYRLDEVPEELAEEMVGHRKGLPYVNFEKREGTKYYFDYCQPFFDSPDFVNPVDYKEKFLSPVHSLASFLRAQGVEGNPYLLIKKKN